MSGRGSVEFTAEKLYTETAPVKPIIPLYAALPQDPATVQSIGRMEDLTLEAQRNRNRAIGIAPYVPTTAPERRSASDQEYAEPRPEPAMRSRPAAKIPSSSPGDGYALPKPLLSKDAPAKPPLPKAEASGYALPKPLIAKEPDYAEPQNEAYALPKPLMAQSGAGGGLKDKYAVPKPLLRDDADDEPHNGDVYAVPKKKGAEPAMPRLPPRMAETPVAPPRLSLTTPDSVALMGVASYAGFLNQTYQRLVGVMLSEKPTFRTKNTLPSGCGAASNQQLFMYYHERNSSWAIGLKLGSMGVIAYRMGSRLATPCDAGSGVWHISNEKGKFVPAPEVRCIPTDAPPLEGGVASEPAPSPSAAGVGTLLPSGTSRGDAESYLMQHGRSPGSFVVRESTSVTDSFVLTVLGSDQKLSHLRAQKTSRGFVLNSDTVSFPSLRELISYYSNEPIRDMRGLRLGECCMGEQLYEALN